MANKEKLARSATDYARFIDHTLLKPEATPSQIRRLCEEAIEFNFFSVCINPSFIETAKAVLAGSNVKVCTVIGFPLGAGLSKVKFQEAAEAVRLGADELDMVIAIGRLKESDLDFVVRDIAGVVEAARGRKVKVIIETSLLNEAEKIAACEAAKAAGAHFVKTSTGFNGGGATVEDVRLMKSVVGDRLEVKASGGIRNLASLIEMVDAGATRIGTSQGPQLLSLQTTNSKEY